jgi:hypothetical protein
MTALHGAAALVVVLASVARAAAAEPALVATLEKTDGSTVSGPLAEISPAAVRLRGADPVPVGTVRRVMVGGEQGRGTVSVECVDGGTLSGSGFTWDGGAAVIAVGGGTVELPAQRVRSVTLRPPRGTADAAPPDWRGMLPESPQSDLLVVGKQEGDGERLDLVECAIAAVAAETVTVVLDDERIPVNRAKVVGMWFLREPLPAGGTRVDVVGGSLPARTVAWTPEALVVDDAVRLPAALLRSIDYAAGRTVRLARLEPEQSETEPFFGALGRLEGLGPYFAPRFVGPEPAALVLRPRSHVVWRVPNDARRFRTTVAAAPGKIPGGVPVTVLLDGREVFRRRIDDATVSPVEVDVSGGRRLAIKVEFPAGGGMGCPLRFSDPVFEK